MAVLTEKEHKRERGKLLAYKRREMRKRELELDAQLKPKLDALDERRPKRAWATVAVHPADVAQQRRQHEKEMDRVRQAELQRADRRNKEAEFGLLLIREGMKVLAKKHHPDVGGSGDDMVLLTRARDRLKANV